MNDFIEIQLGDTFLINAGIVGLMKFLEHNSYKFEKYYSVENQCLRVNKAFFSENDIASYYIKTITEIYKGQTWFGRVLSQKSEVCKLAALQEPTKEKKNRFDASYKEFADALNVAADLDTDAFIGQQGRM